VTADRPLLGASFRLLATGIESIYPKRHASFLGIIHSSQVRPDAAAQSNDSTSGFMRLFVLKSVQRL
jgi:hypothetical protein